MPEWAAIAAIIFGVGSPIAALILVLRWLIRRQADGNWILRADHDEQMAGLNKQITDLQLLATENRGTSAAKDKVISEQAVALRQSTDSTRYIDMIVRRAFSNAAEVPNMGDNGSEEAPN